MYFLKSAAVTNAGDPGNGNNALMGGGGVVSKLFVFQFCST